MNNQNSDEIQVEDGENDGPSRNVSQSRQPSLPLSSRGNSALDDDEEDLARQMADADDIEEYAKPNKDNQEFIEDTEGTCSLPSYLS